MTNQKKSATAVEEKPGAKPAAKKPVVTKKAAVDQIEDSLQEFLRTRGLSGDNVRTALAELNINSLTELRLTVAKPRAMAVVKERLKDHPIAVEALDALTVESIDNAIFLADEPGAESKASALRTFLVRQGVLADRQEWDSLFTILRSSGVTSLDDRDDGLRAIKGGTAASEQRHEALVTKIRKWDAATAARFAAITAAQVAAATRGRAAEATPELKAFLQKNGLPDGTDKELADFGVTTLEQLQAAKQDSGSGGRFEQLQRRLEDSGIAGAAEQIEQLKPGDLDQEIAEVRSGTSRRPGQTTAKLDAAIAEAQALRGRVETASEAERTAVTTDVSTKLAAVKTALNGVSLTDMSAAATAGSSWRDGLVSLLSTTITNATAAKQTLEGIDTTVSSWPSLITKLSMLRGFTVSPAKTTQGAELLVAMPPNPAQLVLAGGNQKTFTKKFKGSRTESFAVASALSSSSSLASAAEGSGGGFAGAGVVAVSAAASYADAKEASRESSNFDTATYAGCGEINYAYIPKESIQFDTGDTHVSDRAVESLRAIAGAGPAEQSRLVRVFFDKFGSHFFMHQILGGRYQLTSIGSSSTVASKASLVSAVAQTTKWAAAASASYVGMGGAVQAAASVEGQKSVASADGSRYGLNFDDATVEVSTEAVGGAAGTGPRDVWEQSLRYNSTWAVIDRAAPRGVWELVQADTRLGPELRALAPLLERMWVREVYLPAIEKTYPALHDHVSKQASITTCTALDAAAILYQGEPPLEITVITATSRQEGHPRVTAGTDDQRLKLIGGGAHVDYGTGPGALLTGSYPWGNSWVATAKDHMESSPSTVTAFAIYLNDPYDLWEVATVMAKSPERGNRPTVTAVLPPEFALTGGGGLVDWDGPGILLTACGPEQSGTYGGTTHRGWTVKGKDHYAGDRGSATAWVIGIRPRNGSQPSRSKVYTRAAQGSHAAVDLEAASPTDVVVGGGAAVTWPGAEGGMLTSTGFVGRPRDQKWQARAKDHLKWENLDLTMWVITRPGHLA